jgi:hypothetical protein
MGSISEKIVKIQLGFMQDDVKSMGYRQACLIYTPVNNGFRNMTKF